jgi:hypothetical protein
MNDHAQPYAPPRSRWGVFLTCAAVLFAAVLAIWFYLGYRNETVLQKTLEETQRREPDGWQLEDLERRRRPVADADNLGLLLHAAKRLRPQQWMYWEGWPASADDAERSQEAFEHLNKMEELAPNRRLSERQLNALRNELCRGREFLEAVHKAVEKPWGRYPITYSRDGISTLLPFTQDARDYANALCWDAMLRAEHGDLAGALDACRGVVHCNRAIGDEPTLISVLVRIAIRARAIKKLERVLAQGEPPAEALANLQRRFEEEEAEAILAQGARGERALLDRMMRALQRGELTYAQVRAMMSTGARGQLYGLEDWAFWATAGPADLNRAAFLKLTNQFVEIAGMPVEDMPAAMKQLEASVQYEPKFVRTLFPAVTKVTGAYVRVTTQTRCARVMLAAERYRLKHGRWPEKLEELVPEFLDQAPLDPHDGQPLRWVRRADGWTVYSVSHDRVDDGGKLSERYPQQGTDLGLRLYDVNQRRLPYQDPSPPGP